MLLLLKQNHSNIYVIVYQIHPNDLQNDAFLFLSYILKQSS